MANPANVLARLVAGLVDETGRVTIHGFSDDVRELPPAERDRGGRDLSVKDLPDTEKES